MSIAESLVPEFDYEIGVTRKFLTLVPESQKDWAPHPKSQTLGRLAAHVAEIPGWLTTTVTQDSLDFSASEPGAKSPFVTFTTTNELVTAFDAAAKKARADLMATSDEKMFQEWELLNAGHSIFKMPRVAVLSSFIMKHLVHHRAQLGVYFRLLDVPVPSSYGPSADQQ
ncbi:MAG: DUF664 domain-containing protein [Deltaproteobacteria bacterium]|nr:DUF664 domain-containing protein [Deltaproteobacteria bacterium]